MVTLLIFRLLMNEAQADKPHSSQLVESYTILKVIHVGKYCVVCYDTMITYYEVCLSERIALVAIILTSQLVSQDSLVGLL